MKRTRILKRVKRAVLQRANGFCEGTDTEGEPCTHRIDRYGAYKYNLDHIIPLHKWPTDADPDEVNHEDNLQILCNDCHNRKTKLEHVRMWAKRSQIDPNTGYKKERTARAFTQSTLACNQAR